MARHDPDMLKQITDKAEQWLRRCNGRPTAGVPTDRNTLRLVLATSDAVATDSFGVITWRAAGREFTAEPVRDGAAGALEH